MLLYLKNLLPQLQQFSKKLDQQTIFIDKPWVMIDESNNYHHYSFLKDGRFIMVLNGKAQVGSWEYISGSNSLLIDRGIDKIFLNQVFIQDGLMFLKKDGNDNDNWILINKNIIPDLDYSKYLRNLFITSKGLKLIKGLEGDYYITQYYEHDWGEQLYDRHLNPVQNSIIKTVNNKSIIVKSGKIDSTYYTKTFNSVSGQIVTINLSYQNEILVNNTVIVDNDFKVTGKYKFKPKILEKVSSIEVKEGKIEKVNNGIHKPLLILVVIMVLFISVVIFIAIPAKKETVNNSIQLEDTVRRSNMNINDNSITTTVISAADTVAKYKSKSTRNKK